MLAFLALRRPRILVLVVAPYAATLAVVAALTPLIGGSGAVGMRAIAFAPALLAAPRVAALVGGRRDRAGALTAGTLAAAVLLNALGPGGFRAFGPALVAFVVGVAVAGAIPMLPDVVRAAIRRGQDAAYLLVLGAAAVAAAGSVDAGAIVIAALLLAAGTGAAALVAAATGIDLGSALSGSATRDPAVGLALALDFGPAAAAIPLAYAALLVVPLAVLALRAGGTRPTIHA
jgi:hypothetical protein